MGYLERVEVFEHPFLYEYLHPEPELFTLSHVYALAPGAYEDALAEANRIQELRAIPMTVESVKPVHLKLATFKLPVGDTIGTLKENTAFYPVGLYSIDPDFEAMKWYRGAKTVYLYDWLAKFVAQRKEKQQTMTPQPVYKGGETFTFTVVSTVAKPQVDAWLLGYVVLPQAMLELPIIG